MYAMKIKELDTKFFLQIFAWIALLAYCIYCGLRYSENITLIQAMGGWSPMDWVAHQLSPKNFTKDFPSGISAYRMSSLMQLYLSVARFGIDLEVLIPWMIYFEIVFLGLGVAVFLRTLVPQSPYIAMAIAAVMVVEGGARSMELARFGGAFYQGLFYNIADGIRLMGIAALFRGRITLAALLLGIGITVHPVMVGMACIFVAPFVILRFRNFSLQHWLVAAVVFLAVSITWFIFRTQSVEISSGGIPNSEWLDLVRMFSYHWFPVDIGVFTGRYERYVIPILCLIALAIIYLPLVVHGCEERKAIFWGMGLLSVLAISGVLISVYSSEPFLIKLALHRASDMLILVCLVIVVAGLTEEILSGNILGAVLGGFLILSPLLRKGVDVPFPALATILILNLYMLRAYIKKEVFHLRLTALSLVVLVFILISYYINGISNVAAYHGSKYTWMLALLFITAPVMRWSWTKFNLKPKTARFFLEISLLGIVLLFSFDNVQRITLMPSDRKELAKDYLAVQRWAREATKPDALFMVDPTIYYGWRDFSQRSSFGNLREWLHTGWLYDSRESVYREGIERFSEFGVVITPYKEIKPSIQGFHALSNDLRGAFYQKNQRWFEELSDKYEIDFIVLQKKFISKKFNLEIIFENKNFIVYKFSK